MSKKQLTVDDIKLKLDELGVEYSQDATDDEIFQLYSDNFPKNTTQSSQNQVVQIPKSQFDDLMKRIADLEATKSETKPTEPTRTIGKRQVKVRFYKGKMVVGYGASRPGFDARQQRYILAQELLLDGGEKIEVPNAIEFRESGEFKMAEVEKVEETPGVTKQGFVYRTEFDYAHYTSHKSEDLVPLEVNSVKRTFHLVFEDGSKAVLPEEALN